MGSAWFSRRAVLLHLTAIVVVPGCVALGWWQVHRALSGNGLSWAYAVEWPVFACYGVYMWWKLVHEQAADRPVGPSQAAGLRAKGAAADAPPRRESEEPIEDDEEDDELAAYNRYLAQLSAADKQKRF